MSSTVSSDETFSARCSLATALALDDRAAWWTSDSITAAPPINLDSLDNTWFVRTTDEKRLVFYGRYAPLTDTYTVKYAFEVANDSSITRLDLTVDTTTLEYARAVYTGIRRFQSILDSFMLDFKFNHYIRRNDDRTFSMWFLPAGIDNYCAYGLEIYLSINTAGTSILASEITGNELKYFEPKKHPEAIELDNTCDVVPSIGNIFFVITFGKHFKRITIKNKNSISMATLSSDNVSWQWMHSNQ